MRLAPLQAVLLLKHAANKRRVLSKSHGLQFVLTPKSKQSFICFSLAESGN